MSATGPGAGALSRTPLHDLHLELGARMVPFAGHELPLHYRAGVLKEHLHCRAAAALFDVSHMGQVMLPADAAEGLEALIPADLIGLAAGRQRYGVFTDAQGGILDDLMAANLGDGWFLVVNAARRADDLAHLAAHLAGVRPLDDRALLALQGPAAEAALAGLGAPVAQMRFMDIRRMDLAGVPAIVARSGYTGEDGFEISLPAAEAEAVARRLLAAPGVMPAGLGARDSLRIEAGLCLYGADIDTTTSPVEAGLAWSIGRARRRGGPRAGGFPGAERILAELESGPARLRAGLRPEGRAPVRAGAALFDAPEGGAEVGRVTSGTFGPSLDAPCAMGYVPAALARPGTALGAELRGRRVRVTVAPLPFVKPGYKRA
ncbi:MAG: glycine cleavage system aminomethyltransferase GcvT [Alphaproteobacteria bacterium]|nr:MAG: glycine cleavage system aminomethyltransferase GcvT [Alphaproteobacteria bacterium]